jgi:hypothetical protein
MNDVHTSCINFPSSHSNARMLPAAAGARLAVLACLVLGACQTTASNPSTYEQGELGMQRELFCLSLVDC